MPVLKEQRKTNTSMPGKRVTLWDGEGQSEAGTEIRKKRNFPKHQFFSLYSRLASAFGPELHSCPSHEIRDRGLQMRGTARVHNSTQKSFIAQLAPALCCCLTVRRGKASSRTGRSCSQG